LATAIRFLGEDEEARKRMGMNSRRLAEDKFDRNKTYQEIINVITGK
jgi:glycosyltransferase involved in cell wall biosynthesis